MKPKSLNAIIGLKLVKGIVCLLAMFVSMYCALWILSILMFGAIEMIEWMRVGSWTSLDGLTKGEGWKELSNQYARISLVISIITTIIYTIKSK